MSCLKSLALAAALTAALAVSGAASASAQAYYDPGYTLRMMSPVMVSPCPGGRCSADRPAASETRPNTPTGRSPASRTARSEQAASDHAEATCANARRMAAEGNTDPRLPQLIRLCAQRDHYAEQIRRVSPKASPRTGYAVEGFLKPHRLSVFALQEPLRHGAEEAPRHLPAKRGGDTGVIGFGAASRLP